MAATVLSGNGAVAYTNNTGQNVRVIINYFKGNHAYNDATKPFIYTIAWGNGAAAYYTASNNQAGDFWYGKNIAFFDSVSTASQGGNSISLAVNNLVDTAVTSSGHFIQALPTEVMLANGQTFSITAVNNSALSGQAQSVTIDGSYNILVIPEGG